MKRRILVMLPTNLPHFSRILTGIEHRAWEIGGVFVNTANMRNIERHLQSPWDGIVSIPNLGRWFEQLCAQGCPVINVSSRIASVDLTQIVSDDREIGRVAAQHLCDLGYRNLVATRLNAFHFSNLRVEGFIEEAARLGKRAEIVDLDLGSENHPDFTVTQQRLRDRIDRFLDTLDDVYGCFAEEDALAYKIWRQAVKKGISIPAQMGLIGVGNSVALGQHPGCPLSSVDPDCEGIGRHAVDAILRPEELPTQRLLLPKGVVARETTGRPLPQDPLVQEAMGKIDQEPFTPWTVNDLASALNVHRKTLSNHFSGKMGTSLRRILLEARMREARRLLATTTINIGEVGFQVGYSEESAFSTAFRKEHGISPVNWRARQESAQDK